MPVGHAQGFLLLFKHNFFKNQIDFSETEKALALTFNMADSDKCHDPYIYTEHIKCTRKDARQK